MGREDVIGVLTHELKRLDPKHVGAGTAGFVSIFPYLKMVIVVETSIAASVVGC